MQDNVRTIQFAPDDEESDSIEANHRMMDMLCEFLDETSAEIFVGAIQITADAVLVQFEALQGVDPDEIVARHHHVDADAERTREDRSHGPDDTTPDPSPTGDAAASTGERDASHADTDADTVAHPAGSAASDDADDSPPWESDGDDDTDEGEGRARPWALVREDESVIATYGSNEAAWDAFENHDDAFDVLKRED